MPVLMPPCHLLIEFQDWAKDAINQVRLLMKQKKQLVQARDILLPKLMSGEIAV
jgi:type I restriction enzyme S subunit